MTSSERCGKAGARSGWVVLATVTLGLACGRDDPAPTAPPDPPPPQPSSVVVEPNTLALRPGDTSQLSAEVRDQNGAAMPGTGVTWSTDDATVATVDASGLVTGVAVGEARIRAATGSVATEVEVTVVDPSLGASRLAVGDGLACALSSSGQAYCWGAADRLGAGPTPPVAEPAAVHGGHTFTHLSSLGYHTCGLTPAGDVYCWGYDVHGQITGTPSELPVLAPVRAPLPGPMAYVSAGRGHSCAVDPRGQAYCWGENREAQLGIGEATPTSPPIAVAEGLVLQSIHAGKAHTCAVAVDGLAYCWGWVGHGRLGGGVIDGDAHPDPILVDPDLRFRQLAVGGDFNCGVSDDSLTYCWGEGGTGETFSPVEEPGVPVAVPELGPVEWVSAGQQFACAQTVEGPAYCWGQNRHGQLGDGTTQATMGRPPVAVAGGPRFVEIATGSTSTCGRSASGEIHCWGSNSSGQLGVGLSPQRFAPVRVPTGLRFERLFAGGGTSCGLDAGATLHCWGSLVEGPEVQEIAGGVTSIELADRHQCILTHQGTSLCWGDNDRGQLGVGGLSARPEPTPVATDSSLVDIGTSERMSCGVTTGGALLCWGDDAGRVGFGDGQATWSSTVPVPAVPGVEAVAVELGSFQGCALEAAGSVTCWTASVGGAIGARPFEHLDQPYRVEVDATFVDLDVGQMHVCALDDTGTVWCFGERPQAGVGHRFTPGTMLDDAAAVATGRIHSCALTTAGEAYCWGWGGFGELGRRDVVWSNTPVRVDAGVRFESLVAGDAHNCALTASGEAYCWGGNGTGAVGVPFLLQSEVPMQTLPF